MRNSTFMQICIKSSASQSHEISGAMLDWFNWCAVEGPSLAMVHLIPSSYRLYTLVTCPKQMKSDAANPGRLFLAEGCCTLVLELLVECVTVTDCGNVVSFKSVSHESRDCTRLQGFVEPRVHRSRTVPPAIAGSQAKTCTRVLAELRKQAHLHLKTPPELQKRKCSFHVPKPTERSSTTCRRSICVAVVSLLPGIADPTQWLYIHQ